MDHNVVMPVNSIRGDIVVNESDRYNDVMISVTPSWVFVEVEHDKTHVFPASAVDVIEFDSGISGLAT